MTNRNTELTAAAAGFGAERQRIAVIGAGISGLASAYLLASRHEVTLYEAASYLGGHSNTVDVTVGDQTHPVDTGFLVYNERTYPNLVRLFAELGVRAHRSEMSFGVSLDDGSTEWAGTNLDSVFAQRQHLVSPRFLGMLADINRFNRESRDNLAAARVSGLTLGELLDRGAYGRQFREAYLLPMVAAIWSGGRQDVLKFPAESFLQFALNHGLLQLTDRPQWLTVDGGSRRYVGLIRSHLKDVRVACPVRQVRRLERGVEVTTALGVERFDAVVFATHAPTTLQLLVDALPEERAALGPIRYQTNLAVLHRDAALLPRRRKVWSAWNYLGRSTGDEAGPVCVSYLINKLQPIPFATPIVVTLNPFVSPDPSLEFGRFSYEHPILDAGALAAQARLPAAQGLHRAWFAGAWSGYGFHEDGLRSALRVAAAFGAAPAWAVM
ncbi:MAG: FAD-dependent oxidoreductase [Proteobacteria bacterium]|nr:FAD-dependent oxidoreductase [Pseudomonadota bacterium]